MPAAHAGASGGMCAAAAAGTQTAAAARRFYRPLCAEKDGSFLRKLLPQGFDTGDLLILLILLLLLIDGDEDDTVSVLLTFAAFLLL